MIDRMHDVDIRSVMLPEFRDEKAEIPNGTEFRPEKRQRVKIRPGSDSGASTTWNRNELSANRVSLPTSR